MFLMAHTGITLGAAYFLERAYKMGRKSRPKAVYGTVSTGSIPAIDPAEENQTNKNIPEIHGCQEPYNLTSEDSDFKVDYRFILLGSILPDLIDKPIGNVFLSHIFSNGRTLECYSESRFITR